MHFLDIIAVSNKPYLMYFLILVRISYLFVVFCLPIYFTGKLEKKTHRRMYPYFPFFVC